MDINKQKKMAAITDNIVIDPIYTDQTAEGSVERSLNMQSL